MKGQTGTNHDQMSNHQSIWVHDLTVHKIIKQANRKVKIKDDN